MNLFITRTIIITIDVRAAGTYEDMRTGPHHVFKIEGGKSEFYSF
jgi:hypothetical protein